MPKRTLEPKRPPDAALTEMALSMPRRVGPSRAMEGESTEDPGDDEDCAVGSSAIFAAIRIPPKPDVFPDGAEGESQNRFPKSSTSVMLRFAADGERPSALSSRSGFRNGVSRSMASAVCGLLFLFAGEPVA
jgi:hypothetical protein